MNATRRRLAIAALAGGTLVATAAATASTSTTSTEGRSATFSTRLTGYQETPLALSSPATGFARVKVDERAQTLDYRLFFTGTPTAVTQAHIHFGAVGQSGGISVFLCSNLGNGPAGTPACPASGVVSGMLEADAVIGPAAQGIDPGQMAELIDAIQAGVAYVNVHTTAFGGGEIRGQLKRH
jgi:hypothetical protein